MLSTYQGSINKQHLGPQCDFLYSKETPTFVISFNLIAFILNDFLSLFNLIY